MYSCHAKAANTRDRLDVNISNDCFFRLLYHFKITFFITWLSNVFKTRSLAFILHRKQKFKRFTRKSVQWWGLDMVLDGGTAAGRREMGGGRKKKRWVKYLRLSWRSVGRRLYFWLLTYTGCLARRWRRRLLWPTPLLIDDDTTTAAAWLPNWASCRVATHRGKSDSSTSLGCVSVRYTAPGKFFLLYI